MILGVFLIVIGFVLTRWDWMQVIANYLSLSADDKVQYDVNKLAVLFRNVLLFMGATMISGELLAGFLSEEMVNSVFLWGAIITGVSYFTLKANSIGYRLTE